MERASLTTVTTADSAKILMTIGSFAPGYRAGGPVKSVSQLLDTLEAGISVSLITRDRDMNSRTPYKGISGRWVGWRQSRVFYLDPRNPSHWSRLGRSQQRYCDVLYLNSLWEPLMVMLPAMAAVCGILRAGVIIVAPRGGLSPGALALKTPKKRAGLRFWQFMAKRLPLVFHATSELEASHIRSHFPSAPIAVYPNHVTLDAPRRARPSTPGAARFVFISRVSRKKNLLAAIEALTLVKNPMSLDIYGPIEDDDYWQECEMITASLPEHVTVNYRGELLPNQVQETFSLYDAFIFPTLGENYGHVVYESLSAGCPVICTDTTPWTPTLSAGAGTVVAAHIEALAFELERRAAMSAHERTLSKEETIRVFAAWARQHQGRNILNDVGSRALRLHPEPPPTMHPLEPDGSKQGTS